ncbi:MAG: hypothetical protein MRY83_16065, partial [Flavobacteriales bacterium]|nr:hypothetical protein [Flavobacteriales bacterium]
TGTNNTAVGKYSLYRINTEAENTAVGTNSLWNLTTGDDNVGIGDDALSSMTSGSANVALGENVGTGMSSGNNNVLVGRQSFMGRPSGSNNVGLGYEAGIGSDAISGSVFVGYRAGFFESSSNRLYIENSNTNGSNALIYGEFDNDSIRLNANTYVKNDLTVGNDVLFENLSGSGTRMAIINDNGNLSTQTLASGGDLSGNFPNLSVQGIRGNPISATTPSVDQVLKWDGTNWSPQADNTEDLSDTWHSVGSAGEPAFQNSWVNTFANIDYDLMFKKVGSVVWIRGAVQKSGASGTTTLFTLPAGYRPGKNTNVRQLSIVFSNPYEIVIYSNGNVDLQKGGGMHVYTFEISYRID